MKQTDADVAAAARSEFELRGYAIFFNGSLLHGSGRNVTKDRFRRSYICH